MHTIPNFESAPARWLRKLNNFPKRYLSHTKVLLYHRITNLASDPLELSVTPEIFHEQLTVLKKKYAIISADEFADSLLKRKKIKGQTILITFDDGYADNLLEAVPVLESLKIPALFFITTSQLNTDKLLWWDELEQLVLDGSTLPDEISFAEDILGETQQVFACNDRQVLYDHLHDLLKYATLEKRNRILDALRSQIIVSSTPRNNYRLLTHEELQTLSRSAYATIGAHTVNHTSLGIQEPVIQEYELSASKKELKTLTGKPVNYFSYPYGSVRDLNDTTATLAAKAGFKLSFTNYYGFATIHTSNHKIPRILVRNWNSDQLLKQVNKLF